MTSFAVTKDGSPNVGALIKAIGKELEERGILEELADKNAPKSTFTEQVYLACLVFSYLEPASKLSNKKV